MIKLIFINKAMLPSQPSLTDVTSTEILDSTAALAAVERAVTIHRTENEVRTLEAQEEQLRTTLRTLGERRADAQKRLSNGQAQLPGLQNLKQSLSTLDSEALLKIHNELSTEYADSVHNDFVEAARAEMTNRVNRHLTESGAQITSVTHNSDGFIVNLVEPVTAATQQAITRYCLNFYGKANVRIELRFSSLTSPQYKQAISELLAPLS